MKVSATKHHCLSGEKYKASRPLDYIYDPLFTFAGPKDYYRTAHESIQSSSEFSVQPIFDSMFSDMVRFPRAMLVLRPSHKLPGNIDTSYRGRVKAISQERTITAEVTGTDRFKYFRRPVTEAKDGSPSEPAMFPPLGLKNVTSLGLLAPPTTAQKPPTRYAATQVRATQTDYRESEAQTVPWTPPYTTRGDSTPEVLYLDQLSWGNGLPPGQHEVEVVERLRKKRAWEERLPPPDCWANIKLRAKLIAEMESSDWKFREREIESVHKERMRLAEQLIEKHTLMTRSRHNCRMQFLSEEFNRRKEQKLQIIRRDHERALRKLSMLEKGYDPKKKYKMSPLDEHLQHSSELYAPMKRSGVSFRNRNETLAQRQFTINDSDVCEQVFGPVYRPVFDYHKASRPKRQTELCERETRWTMTNLVQLHQNLQKLRAPPARLTKAEMYAGMEARPKPSLRPEVPTLECARRSLTDEALFQAAVMIQRVVHSRAMQTMMLQKLESWKELIQELKTLRIGQSLPDQSNRMELILQARKTGVLDNLIGLNVGTSIGQTLSLLASELLTFKNEGVAAAQALQAEAARWRRELPEEGRRQLENRRREEHNMMFAQLLEVYQDSINACVVRLAREARENEAKQQAYEHAQEVARLAELDRLGRPPTPEEEPVSADLLLALVAPEGLRELTRTCLLILRHKYLQARNCLAEGGLAEATEDSPRSTVASQGSEDIMEMMNSLVEEIFTSVGERLGEQSEKSGESVVERLSERSEKSGVSVVERLSERSEVTGESIARSQSQSRESKVLVLFEGSDRLEEMTYDGSTAETSAALTGSADIGSEGPDVSAGPCRSLGLRGDTALPSVEDRLLARVTRDMCYVAGSILHTAAKILNKAIQLAGIPQESFDEALRRTMLVINSALTEVIGLILPKKPEEEQQVSEELILEASKIVNEILEKAKQRIAEMKEEERLKVPYNDAESQGRVLVEDVIKEAQQRVLRMIVEDFLQDLFKEAVNKVSIVPEN